MARSDGLVLFEAHLVLLGDYVSAVAFDLINHDVDVAGEPPPRSLFHVKEKRVYWRSQLLLLI